MPDSQQPVSNPPQLLLVNLYHHSSPLQCASPSSLRHSSWPRSPVRALVSSRMASANQAATVWPWHAMQPPASPLARSSPLPPPRRSSLRVMLAWVHALLAVPPSLSWPPPLEWVAIWQQL